MALTDNLLSYYKLDGNANDSTGSHNLTATNISYTAGKIGDCGSLNGSNAYFSASNSINNIAAGTISLWVKRDVIDAQHSFVNKLQSGVKDHIQFMYEGIGGVGNNKVRFRINDQTLASSGAMTDTTNFIHRVGTWSSGGMKLYKNGTLDNSNILNAQLANYNTTVYFGTVSLTGGYMDGLLDELGIWSRALSAAEVSELYNSGAGKTYPFASPANTAAFFSFFN